MKILVCVKQVPDLEARFRPNAAGDWIEEQDLAFRVNEYDEFAIEQAVQLKEKMAGAADVTVLSLGPARVVEAIKKGLAMGGDRGVHILDDGACHRDPWQVASILAAFARGKGFDLVLTGMQSQDRGSAQVGVLLAEMLGFPCVTTLVGLELEGGILTARRELEGGVRGVLRLRLPAVLTCQLGLNTPRYPTLPNIMKARQKELLTLPVDAFAAGEALVRVERIQPPEKRAGGLVLEGEVNEMADRILGILKEKTGVVR